MIDEIPYCWAPKILLQLPMHLSDVTISVIRVFTAGQRKAASLIRFPRKRTNCKYFELKIYSQKFLYSNAVSNAVFAVLIR